MHSTRRLLASLLLSACMATPGLAQTPAPLPFEAIQPADFAVVPGGNSISNAWADFDNDGDLDLAVSLKTGEVRLYRNDKGKFVSVGTAMGLPQKGGFEVRGLSWGDYDGDGWVDLLAGPNDPKNPTRVYHNDKGKGFTEVAAKIGLSFSGRSSRQSSWLDYDNDGDLDLFVTDRIGKNRLFRNDGGSFVEVMAGSPLNVFKSTVGACWLDYDKDGDLDLFLANQSGATDSFFRNDGATFVDVAPALGMDSPGRAKDEGGVGCAVGDYDNDGNLDIFEPNYGRNKLWHNNGDGTFTDVAKQLGVDTENHAVGAAWGDYDNDGLLDLFVTSYVGPRDQQVPKDALFHNEGARGFVNVAAGTLIDVADHGVQWVDYDKDGGLDLSVTDNYGPTGGHPLFRNTLPAAGKRSLAIQVTDAKGIINRFGAEVRLFDTAGKIVATRQVSTGGGYNSQSTGPLVFGLTSMAPVKVEVTFMSAKGRKVQTIAKVDPKAYRGKVLTVKEK
ncbi:CRTAC1 family protein [Sphingomonas naphthae]|uniref:CRTAC1 family protein n=1 Tax=Sphingomonas naphthae TaxID=1813468 RepID=A0ABY7TNY0_9SPHN|nr:CRTAC1 family protein [Sphingomonas naphthae]WCT74411.1 CRTAC1 family protein [Sphingomonas naphthae]